MTRLTLIRHGQTPANVLGLLDTDAPGPGLTDLGLAQAAALPRLLVDSPIDRVYVSRLVRTHFTARPLANDRAYDLVELPGVHEVEAGSLEKRGDEAAVRRYMETAFAWGGGNLDARMPDGPDGYDFFGRYDADIERVVRESQHPVIVSHGAAIRIWVAARAKNIGPEFTALHHLPNTGVVELEGSPGDWRLLSWPNAPIDDPDPVDREFGIAEAPATVVSTTGAVPTQPVRE
ncbi:MAG: histidine phosphatase family protein [Microbacteriaceae bacterium]|nr:histidine phosphatase family protein [Microbacteriaceae bacterium]